MKNHVINGAAMILCGLLIAFGPQFLFKACGSVDGGFPRSHWSVQVEIGIGMIIVLLGICYMFFVNPQIQFGLTIGIFFASIFALSIPNVLIGGCSMMTMSCRRTAFPALNVISTFVLIGSVANLVYLANKTKMAIVSS